MRPERRASEPESLLRVNCDETRDEGLMARGRLLKAAVAALFGKSRSDCVMVAVGFSPRDNGRKRLRVAARRLNRRANRALHASLRDARFLRSLPVGLSPWLPSWPR